MVWMRRWVKSAQKDQLKKSLNIDLAGSKATELDSVSLAFRGKEVVNYFPDGYNFICIEPRVVLIFFY